MKKNFLLPFCLVCICGVSACGSFSGSNGQTDTLTAEEAPVIDATINPYDRCGVNGISCNDTALVNCYQARNGRRHGQKKQQP